MLVIPVIALVADKQTQPPCDIVAAIYRETEYPYIPLNVIIMCTANDRAMRSSSETLLVSKVIVAGKLF